jgi:citrate lyase subunit alpha/citrate CoA-transferase
MRGRLPIVRDAVTTVTTPGETVDVIVTERGICVADKHADLKQELRRRNLPVKDIHAFHDEITRLTGVPRPVDFEDKIVALIEYRDGSIIDVVRQVRE